MQSCTDGLFSLIRQNSSSKRKNLLVQFRKKDIFVSLDKFSNDRPFGCPIIYTDTNSQYYFVHKHLNNASHNNVHLPIWKVMLSQVSVIRSKGRGIEYNGVEYPVGQGIPGLGYPGIAYLRGIGYPRW